jgi:hypothetical protein
MNRFDGTAARQLALVDDQDARGPKPVKERPEPRRPRLLQKDIYAQLARRRRRAQIAARHLLEK